jgi:hypothetical protein
VQSQVRDERAQWIRRLVATVVDTKRPHDANAQEVGSGLSVRVQGRGVNDRSCCSHRRGAGNGSRFWPVTSRRMRTAPTTSTHDSCDVRQEHEGKEQSHVVEQMRSDGSGRQTHRNFRRGDRCQVLGEAYEYPCRAADVQLAERRSGESTGFHPDCSRWANQNRSRTIRNWHREVVRRVDEAVVRRCVVILGSGERIGSRCAVRAARRRDVTEGRSRQWCHLSEEGVPPSATRWVLGGSRASLQAEIDLARRCEPTIVVRIHRCEHGVLNQQDCVQRHAITGIDNGDRIRRTDGVDCALLHARGVGDRVAAKRRDHRQQTDSGNLHEGLSR